MNQFNPAIHHRRSIRLKGYDYSGTGLYFITACVQHRACLFGNIVDGEMFLNDAGTMIGTEWQVLPARFPHIALHEYVVMPNHFHAILEIVAVGATLVVAQNNNVVTQNNNNNVVVPHGNDNKTNDGMARNNDGNSQTGQPRDMCTKTVGDIMDAFKSITTVAYIRGVKQLVWQPFRGKLWQRDYWEHIIRNEQSYKTISDYIVNNPVKWKNDTFNI